MNIVQHQVKTLAIKNWMKIKVLVVHGSYLTPLSEEVKPPLPPLPGNPPLTDNENRYQEVKLLERVDFLHSAMLSTKSWLTLRKQNMLVRCTNTI